MKRVEHRRKAGVVRDRGGGPQRFIDLRFQYAGTKDERVRRKSERLFRQADKKFAQGAFCGWAGFGLHVEPPSG